MSLQAGVRRYFLPGANWIGISSLRQKKFDKRRQKFIIIVN